MGKDLIYTKVLSRCVLAGLTVPSNWLIYTRGVAELTGKDLIYTRALLRCVLVGPTVPSNVLN